MRLDSPEGDKKREVLWRNLELLRDLLSIKSDSAILPWIVGDEQAALDLAGELQEAGFFVPAIRYPTVPKGSARLRITLTASHEEDQIRSLAEAIKRLTRSNNCYGVRDAAQ